MKFEAQVTEVVKRNAGVESFRFSRPSKLAYKPGQYMLVTLDIAGKEVMHPFSFSSSPTEEDFIEFTKKFSESEYSLALKKLKVGDLVKIDAPYGEFTFTGEYPKISLLAGGIGITPFWSICKYCTDTKLATNIVLLYGCRNENELTFYNELNAMQKQNSNLKVFFVLNQVSSNWNGLSGTINADLIKNQIKDFQDRVFFACGPPGMIVAMKNVISDLGLPSTQLKLESITGHIG